MQPVRRQSVRVRMPRLALVSCLVLVLWAVRTAAAADPDQAGGALTNQATIAGRVLDAVTGAPIAGASLTINRMSDGTPGAPPAMTLFPGGPPGDRPCCSSRTTGEDGRFEITREAGRYRVLFSASGYLPGWYLGGDAPPLPGYGGPPVPLELKPGQRLDPFELRLWPEGRLRGVATDDRGEPLVRARVRLLHRVGGAASPEWTEMFGNVPRLTDDRGVYEFSGLRPGDYTVFLAEERLGDGPTSFVRPPVFYPSSSTADGATVITLGIGERRTGIDVVARTAGVRKLSLVGRASGPTPLPPLTLYLRPRIADQGLARALERTTTAAPDGRFAFPDLLPGEYRLITWAFPEDGPALRTTERNPDLLGAAGQGRPLPPLPGTPTWVAEADVVVSDATQEITLPLQPGARIVGQVVIDPRATPFPRHLLPTIPIVFTPADRNGLTGMPVTGISEDGRFATIGLPPGHYSTFLAPALVRGLEDWYVISTTSNGRRQWRVELGLGDVDYTITLTNRQGDLSGRVVDRKGQPVPRATVTLFPRDAELWPTFVGYSAVADDAGQFRLRRFDTGNYYLVATRTTRRGDAMLAWLESLVPSAVSVQLELGDTRTIDVTLTEP